MRKITLIMMVLLLAIATMASGCSQETTNDLSKVTPKRVITDFAGIDEEGNILLYEDTEYGVAKIVVFVPTLDLSMHPKYATYTLEPIAENLLLLVIDPAVIDRIPEVLYENAYNFVK